MIGGWQFLVVQNHELALKLVGKRFIDMTKSLALPRYILTNLKQKK